VGEQHGAGADTGHDPDGARSVGQQRKPIPTVDLTPRSGVGSRGPTATGDQQDVRQPGVGTPQRGRKRSPFDPNTTSCGRRVTKRATTSAPALPALRNTSSGPSASYTTMSISMALSLPQGNAAFFQGSTASPGTGS